MKPPRTYAGYQVVETTLRHVGVVHYWMLDQLHPFGGRTRTEFDRWQASLPAGVTAVADWTSNALMGEHCLAFADSWDVMQLLRDRTRHIPHWLRIFATPTPNIYERESEVRIVFLSADDRSVTSCEPDLIDWNACERYPHPFVLWMKPLWPLAVTWGPFMPAVRFLQEHVIIPDRGAWETVQVGDSSFFLEDSFHPGTRRGIPIAEMPSRLRRFPLFAQQLQQHYPEKWKRLQWALAPN